MNFATFAPVHKDFNAAKADSMFPNFDALEAEGTEVRTVPDHDIRDHLRKSCELKKLSSVDTEHLLRLVVSFRKFIIPRADVRLANDTLRSQIFHCIEDLVMQHVDVRSSAPVIQRVIAVDCPTQVLYYSFHAILIDIVTIFASANVFAQRCGAPKIVVLARGRQVLLQSHHCVPSLKCGYELSLTRLVPDASSARSLNVLRMAVPNIAEFPNACPALVFHATHDNAEKVRAQEAHTTCSSSSSIAIHPICAGDMLYRLPHGIFRSVHRQRRVVRPRLLLQHRARLLPPLSGQKRCVTARSFALS